jgi:hypothetical protein
MGLSDRSLPPFNYHGFLPEGIHVGTWPEIEARFVTNERRTFLWQRLQSFVERVVATGQFSHIYLDGGFITNKAEPDDIDLILQTRAGFGPEAFRAMEPFFQEGIDTILKNHAVHLHFWCEGFPGGMSDFRRFFQYLRPQEAAPLGLREGAKKGIVKVTL